MGFKYVSIPVTTAGSAGSASGSGVSTSIVRGEILGVYLNFHGSAPATTDTTVKTTGSGPASYTFLTVSISATDGYFAPRSGAVSSSNAAITDSAVPFAVCDTLTVALAQCDALTNAVVAHILYRD